MTSLESVRSSMKSLGIISKGNEFAFDEFRWYKARSKRHFNFLEISIETYIRSNRGGTFPRGTGALAAIKLTNSVPCSLLSIESDLCLFTRSCVQVFYDNRYISTESRAKFGKQALSVSPVPFVMTVYLSIDPRFAIKRTWIHHSLRAQIGVGLN